LVRKVDCRAGPQDVRPRGEAAHKAQRRPRCSGSEVQEREPRACLGSSGITIPASCHVNGGRQPLCLGSGLEAMSLRAVGESSGSRRTRRAPPGPVAPLRQAACGGARGAGCRAGAGASRSAPDAGGRRRVRERWIPASNRRASSTTPSAEIERPATAEGRIDNVEPGPRTSGLGTWRFGEQLPVRIVADAGDLGANRTNVLAAGGIVALVGGALRYRN
jgi:hypothetical protein